MPSIIKVDQIQSDQGFVNVSSNLQFSSGFSMLSPSLSSPTLTTPTTSGVMTLGAGIQFPATQVSSADANTLDDYEEGTWTPAIAPSGGGSITLKNISARYTKVGRMINVWFTAQVNTVSSPTGRMGLTGLPFATSSTPIGGVCLINGFNSFTGHTGTLIEASTTANMDRYNSGGIVSDLASYAATNGYIFFNVTYDIV